MWAAEHIAETDLSPQTVWTALADLHRGTLTYDGADTFELRGPIAVGSTVLVTPVGQDPIESTIIDVVEPVTYADETSFGDVTLVFRHTLEALGDGGTRVTHRLEIDGPAADEVGPVLGPQISGDFDTSMQGLLTAARVHA